MEDQVVDICLSRGKAGLGFNIRGGLDSPYLDGNTGIFVVKIRDSGAAAEDGRLQEGDQIVQINGFDLHGVTHAKAVDHFLNAGDVVKLKVIPGAERTILEERAKRLAGGRFDVFPSSRLSVTAVILAGSAAITLIAVLAYKYIKNRQS